MIAPNNIDNELLNQSPSAPAEYWDCQVCLFHRNENTRLTCRNCEFPKGTVNDNSQNVPQELRWSCEVCLCSDNHPYSEYCAFCGSQKGSPPLRDESPKQTVSDVTEVELQVPIIEIEEAKHEPFPSNHKPPSITTQHSQTCVICDQNLSYNEINAKFRPPCDVCRDYCSQCYANWIKTQITSGRASDLKCPCFKASITYRHVSDLSQYLNQNILELYDQAMRKKVLKTDEIRVTCPDCSYPQDITPENKYFRCGNPRCGLFNIQICTKHQCHYRKFPNYNNDRFCPDCMEEAGSDPVIYNMLQKIIEEALDYRCPSCSKTVGLPDDLVNDCLALSCNHCGSCFCGFCYDFANNWTLTHVHVRCCSRNPRINYFVESPEIWFDLQRNRKQEKVTEMLANHDPPLSEVQKDIIWKRVKELL